MFIFPGILKILFTWSNIFSDIFDFSFVNIMLLLFKMFPQIKKVFLNFGIITFSIKAQKRNLQPFLTESALLRHVIKVKPITALCTPMREIWVRQLYWKPREILNWQLRQMFYPEAAVINSFGRLERSFKLTSREVL